MNCDRPSDSKYYFDLMNKNSIYSDITTYNLMNRLYSKNYHWK